MFSRRDDDAYDPKYMADPGPDPIEGNPRLNYFDLLNFPEANVPPPASEVTKTYNRIRRNLERESEIATADGDLLKLSRFYEELKRTREAFQFFTQDDPDGSRFQRWQNSRTVQGRRRVGARRSPHTSNTRRVPGVLKVPRSSNSQLSDSDVFKPKVKDKGEVGEKEEEKEKMKGKAKGKGKKVGFKLPKPDPNTFSRIDEMVDSPSERRKRAPTRITSAFDPDSIQREEYTGVVDPQIWEDLRISPPPQEVLDAYARYHMLPLEDLEPFAPEELDPSPPPTGNTTKNGQSTGASPGNLRDGSYTETTSGWQNDHMDRELRRRLRTWRELRQPGNLTAQQILERMKEEERNANPREDLDAQVEALSRVPRVPWQEKARQQTLKVHEDYLEQHRILETEGRAEMTDRLRRLNLETPAWMQRADAPYWSPGLMSSEETYTQAELDRMEDVTNINWAEIAPNVTWPAPPTAEQIAESKRQVDLINRVNEPSATTELEEARQPTKEEIRALVEQSEPNKWWLKCQRSWLWKFFFGEDERLLDGREIAAIVPKRYRFKPSVYRLNDNLELEHVCSPGESYFEHLYFSDETFIWPESLPKPPGRSARDRWIMKIQEIDALRLRDSLPPLEPIPGITPTNLPYDPDVFNPPSGARTSRNTGQGTEVEVSQARQSTRRPRFDEWMRAREEQRQRENQNRNNQENQNGNNQGNQNESNQVNQDENNQSENNQSENNQRHQNETNQPVENGQ
ncbi:hypothetical protein TWF281_002050 [Arthrobotrys megalospora]